MSRSYGRNFSSKLRDESGSRERNFGSALVERFEAFGLDEEAKLGLALRGTCRRRGSRSAADQASFVRCRLATGANSARTSSRQSSIADSTASAFVRPVYRGVHARNRSRSSTGIDSVVLRALDSGDAGFVGFLEVVCCLCLVLGFGVAGGSAASSVRFVKPDSSRVSLLLLALVLGTPETECVVEFHHRLASGRRCCGDLSLWQVGTHWATWLKRSTTSSVSAA